MNLFFVYYTATLIITRKDVFNRHEVFRMKYKNLESFIVHFIWTIVFSTCNDVLLIVASSLTVHFKPIELISAFVTRGSLTWPNWNILLKSNLRMDYHTLLNQGNQPQKLKFSKFRFRLRTAFIV